MIGRNFIATISENFSENNAKIHSSENSITSPSYRKKTKMFHSIVTSMTICLLQIKIHP